MMVVMMKGSMQRSPSIHRLSLAYPAPSVSGALSNLAQGKLSRHTQAGSHSCFL